MKKMLRIFLQILYHDIYIYRRQLGLYGTNYIFLYPINYLISIGYMQVKVYFGYNTLLSTELIVGNILILLLGLTFDLAFMLLYDLEDNNHTSYQLLCISPTLFLCEKILFITVFTFLLLVPFYPIFKLFLGAQFYTEHTSWSTVFVLLLLSSLCAATYHLFAACWMKNTKQIINFWIRVNAPIELIGGFWTPLYTLSSFSKILGIISLANPFLYVTEGLRYAFLGGDSYVSSLICGSMLLFFSVLFSSGAVYAFKKKMDHI
jgi:ABC-type multidrug transport system permease subunit